VRIVIRSAAVVAALLLAGCEAPRPAVQASPASPAPATKQSRVNDPAAKPSLVDPGYAALDDSVIAATDTLDTVRARVGATQVVAGKVPGAEGEEFDGWHVYPDDPARRLYVYLDDATHRPVLLRVLDVESTWQRGDGIRMGRTLAELAERNGKPVGFTGFDWDYGGGCCDWNGGALERDPPTGGMTLCPPQTEAVSDPDYPMGDAQFDSNHPWVVAHPPAVCEFSLPIEPRP
jgi:hypothetical protein